MKKTYKNIKHSTYPHKKNRKLKFDMKKKETKQIQHVRKKYAVRTTFQHARQKITEENKNKNKNKTETASLVSSES